jgi:murein DD-endopeptidase / murein LD-carboxypeptidase
MPVDNAVAADAIAGAISEARALLGVPFRLHGRDQHGLDCVGLIALVYRCLEFAPSGYRLRNVLSPRWEGLLERCFLRRVGAAQSGDILFCDAGPAQYHLGIWTGHSLIHADAGIGRVVELAGPVPWPVRSVWHAKKLVE